MIRIHGNVKIPALKVHISKANIVHQLVYKDFINIIMPVMSKLHKEHIASTQIQNNYISAMIALQDVILVPIIFKILV